MGQLKHDMSELVMSSYLEMFCDDTLGGASYDLVKQYVSSMRPDKVLHYHYPPGHHYLPYHH